MRPTLTTAILGVVWATIFGIVIAACFGAPVLSGRGWR
jgi:hypothetical protein